MKKKYVIIALCFIVVGLTTMSSILFINGSIKLSVSQDDFEVVFSDAILDDVNIYSSSISQDRKSINFISNDLKTVNDTSILEYEIYNKSTQYSANVSIDCSGNDNDYIRVDNSLDSVSLDAKELVKGELTITLLKASSEVRTYPLTCNIVAEASENVSNVDNTNIETITLDLQDGVADVTSINVELLGTYGDLPVPTKEGYGFIGWYDSLEDGIIVTKDTIFTHQSPKTLYAKYEPGRFTITFNPDGGTTMTTSKIVTYNQTYGDLPVASKDDSVFIGWYTNLSNGQLIKTSSIVNITGDTTLYAKFLPTSSMMISNTAGDYVQIGTRTFTLNEHDDVVLLRMYSVDDKTSGGYAIAAKSPSDLTGTGSGLTTKSYTLASGNTIYIGYMATPFSIKGSDPVTAYVNGTTGTISTWYDETTDVLFEYLESILYR